MVQQFARMTAHLGRHAATGHLGWIRSAIGGMLGIGIAGIATSLLLGGNAQELPWLVAPLGASAVLVFALPASPLAQPWPVIGGDLISAGIGIAAGHLLHVPWLSTALAVGCAIAVMSMLRCLHPPGGACALLCALGSTGAGWLYNNLTGHPWPHKGVRAPEPENALLHYSHEELQALLSEWNEILDVAPDDLDAFYRALERRVIRRTSDQNQAAVGRRDP